MSTDTDNNGTSNNLSNPFDEFDTVDFKVNIKANFDKTNGKLKLDSVTIEDDAGKKFIQDNANNVNNLQELKTELKTTIESLQTPVSNNGGKKSKSKKQKKTKGKKGKSVKRR
jgi:hypothetical protein